jgi:NAD(P)-dependent dehydrogenase (short-subunit alcohol dehydrogenase family)
MNNRLHMKTAVVTGSTSGVGAATAKAFAAEGAAVVLSGRRKELGEQIVSEIHETGGKACFHVTDVTDHEACAAVCRQAKEQFGGLDILVNNVGLFPRMPLEEITPGFWDEIFAVNTRAPFFCSQAAVPLMRERGGGSIINIGSTLPFTAGGDIFAYGCAKGALYFMTRMLAKSLAKYSIRVNWITVGWILTEKELEIQGWDSGDCEQAKRQEKKLPMGAFNTEEDYSEACIYLASDAAKHVTGTDLNASAGMDIHM